MQAIDIPPRATLIKHIDVEKWEAFNCLTNSMISKKRRSFTNSFKQKVVSFSCNNFKIMKQSNECCVFGFKNRVFKLIFSHFEHYQNELFFTSILYNERIRSIVSENTLLLILPRYERKLKDYKYMLQPTEIHEVVSNVSKELIELHRRFIIHGNISITHVVKMSGTEKKWKLIDYSKSKILCAPNEHDVHYDMTPPECAYYELNPNQKLWLFMKDWFDLFKLFEDEFETTYFPKFKEYYKLKNSDEFKKMLKKLIESLKIKDLPYYLIDF